MAIRLLDLSSELLEMIALNLSSQDCLRLMLTCKTMHNSVCGAPLHHTIELDYEPEDAQRSCTTDRFCAHLERHPSKGVWIKNYDLWSAFGIDFGLFDVGTLAYRTARAVQLADKMPNLLGFCFPLLHSACTANLVQSIVTHVASIKTLQEIDILQRPTDFTLSLEQIAPLLALPALRRISLDGILVDWQEFSPTELVCQTVVNLSLSDISTDNPGLDKLFQIFPSVEILRVSNMPDLATRTILDGITAYYPFLRELSLVPQDTQGDRPPCWLSRLPALESLVLSGRSLDHSDLLELSATVRFLDLKALHLPVASIAYAISKWIKDPAIRYKRRVKLPYGSKVKLLESIHVSHIVVTLSRRSDVRFAARLLRDVNRHRAPALKTSSVIDHSSSQRRLHCQSDHLH